MIGANILFSTNKKWLISLIGGDFFVTTQQETAKMKDINRVKTINCIKI
ncbi:hypothetical protein yrohd0001_37640 [Yersinia rohdei ATCC 43380]|nr:hypothetical protein yrohd0001_37640 [Yersinia rohdei ATCC 43380]